MSVPLEQRGLHRTSAWQSRTEDNRSIGDSRGGLEGPTKERGPSESRGGALTDLGESYRTLHGVGQRRGESEQGTLWDSAGIASHRSEPDQSGLRSPAPQATAEYPVYACNSARTDETACLGRGQLHAARDTRLVVADRITDASPLDFAASARSHEREPMEVDHVSVKCAVESTRHAQSRSIDDDEAALHAAPSPTAATSDTKRDPIWKDATATGVTKADRAASARACHERFAMGGYEERRSPPSTCARTRSEPTAVATANIRLELEERPSSADDDSPNEGDQRRTELDPEPGCRSPGGDARRRISTRESHSESARVSARVNDCHSLRAPRKQGALTKLVECHQYCCVDGLTVGSAGEPQGCRSSIGIGFNENVLKPGIVCREQALSKETLNAEYGLAVESGFTLKAAESSAAEATCKAATNTAPGNRKRLCKSLSNLTADELLSAARSSASHRPDVEQLQRQTAEAAMSNGKSRIAKLITGHIRQAQNDVVSAESSPTQKKVAKRNGSHEAPNGLRKAKSVSDAISELRADKTSPALGKHARKHTAGFGAADDERATKTPDQQAVPSSRKTPKLPKALFPFMRKNRKRHGGSGGATGQRQPLKARGLENEAEFLVAGRSDSVPNLDAPVGDGPRLAEDGVVPIVGFRKIKVNSTPQRGNVHADYASRVTRMRRKSSSTDNETPANSPKHAAHDGSGGVTLRNRPDDVAAGARGESIRPRRSHKNRYSVDLSSTSDSPQSNGSGRTKRPSSFAASSGEQLWPVSGLASAKSDVHIRIPRGELTPSGEQRQLQQDPGGLSQLELRQVQAKLRNHSVAVCQAIGDTGQGQSVDTHRCSLDLQYIRKGSLTDRLAFLASLPGPETTLGTRSISSSLTGISTPRSTVLATGGYGSATRCSLSSSFASVFDDEAALAKKHHNVERTTQGPTPEKVERPVEVAEEQAQPAKLNLRLRRTQSLCKDNLTLKIVDINRRSVSPSFESANFGPSPDEGRGGPEKHPKKLERRFQSLRDFSILRAPQPNKPTTPKPRKMSSGSSCTSLNRFSFQLSQQNLAGHVGNGVQQSVEDCTAAAGDAPAFEFGEVPPRASAKNASIRRRMSLQFLRSLNRDRDDEALKSSPTATAKTIAEWKRHSLAELDIEKVKVAMAKWSVVASGNAASGNRNNRRRIRPLSEVQNLRWEVHAIPEHNEVSSNTSVSELGSAESTRPRSLHLNSFAAGAPLSGTPSTACRDCGAPRRHLTATQIAENRFTLLGSSFSEENLSLTDEEMLPKMVKTQRSLSAIAGLNTVPEYLMRFYPSKYHAEIACACRNASHKNGRANGHLTPFGHGLHNFFEHRTKVRGSTMSGISNESGYGTMTRKGVFARTAEDEDVFLHANSAITREEPTPNIPIEDVVFVEALWDHVTMDNEELGFKVGDVIRVIDMTNIDWWWGELDSNEGWFPATFVRILVNQQLNDDEDGIEIVITPSPALRDDDADHYTSRPAATRSRSVGDDLCQCAGRRSNSSVHCPACGRPLREACETPKTRSATNPPKFQEPDSTPNVTRKQSLSRETIRTNVINEIVSSEKVFVGHLKDVVEGYLSRCKNRSDMFTDEQIAIIFGNIEQIYHFQRDFYEQLESAVNRSSVSLTELGNVFLKHRDGFAIYSEYCNNHPQALALLSQLFAQKKYVHFFEACRLLQKMIGIALDGFLLTPVQKICKYPLQLAELLKYTSQDHPDHAPVQSALEAMKGVARMINERKRHMENIKKISLWQSSILNWQDKDVLERSSELVHSGELYTLSQTKGKPKWRMAFLFDHQMILCKKDILRRDLLYYKARVDLDVCELTPLDGDSPRNSSIAGNDSMNGLTTLQRGWRIVDTATSESACIYCKNEEDFDKWSKAFDVERKLSEVKRAGISEAEEYLARDLVQKSTLSRRAKEASSVRQPVSYRYRVKMAQGADMAAKQKNIAVPPEKSAGFFSNMAGKLTPFRRATTRESSYVF